MEQKYGSVIRALWAGIRRQKAAKASGARYGMYVVTFNAGEDWYYGYMPDTTVSRENPSATGRHGLGLHTAWLQYGDTTDRYVTYFNAGMQAVGWQGPADCEGVSGPGNRRQARFLPAVAVERSRTGRRCWPV